MAHSPLCSIPDCGKPSVLRGWCNAHYRRWQKHGDPLGGRYRDYAHRYYREIVLTYEGDDCLIWPFTRGYNGYAMLTDGNKSRLVSRRVCEEEHGPAPTPKHEAAHSCGKGHEGCVNRHHLSWKTPKANRADKLIHGTHNRGERHRMAKLTEDRVRAIRSLVGGHLSQRAVAEQFGVSEGLVSLIVSRKVWGWLL